MLSSLLCFLPFVILLSLHLMTLFFLLAKGTCWAEVCNHKETNVCIERQQASLVDVSFALGKWTIVTVTALITKVIQFQLGVKVSTIWNAQNSSTSVVCYFTEVSIEVTRQKKEQRRNWFHFWFSTFSMLFRATRNLVGNENTWRWTVCAYILRLWEISIYRTSAISLLTLW